MTRDEMEASREIARARDGRDPASPWRGRSVEENLREFQAMRDGRYDEGAWERVGGGGVLVAARKSRRMLL